MLGQREHVRRNGKLRQVAEVILGRAHLIGVAKRGAEKPLVIGLQRDHPLALREHQPSERHHALAAHGLANDGKGLLSDRLAGSDIKGVSKKRWSICARGTKLSISMVWVLSISIASSSASSTMRYWPLAT